MNVTDVICVDQHQWQTRYMELYLVSVTQLGRNQLQCSLSVENKLFCTHCKNFQQISTNKIKDTQVHV